MSFLQQTASNEVIYDFIYNKCMMLPGLILGFTFHEYAHAKTAYLLGDDTPVYEGRITLNPVRHIDLFGFVCLILLGFGWAKPVHFNPSKLKNPKRDSGLIGVAGPLTNLVLAFVFMIIFTIVIINENNFNMTEGTYKVISNMLLSSCSVNCTLLVFNMIPLPPFDGFHVLLSLIPRRIAGVLNANAFRYIGRYSFLVLIALFHFFPDLLGIPILFVYNSLFNIAINMANMILRFF